MVVHGRRHPVVGGSGVAKQLIERRCWEWGGDVILLVVMDIIPADELVGKTGNVKSSFS
jgi:hypothetical protein